MKRKLRLLLFEECNRHCPGCCNNYWDLNNVPTVKSVRDYKGFEEILLTGGEPMLRPLTVIDTVKQIRFQNDCSIYLYTAKVDDWKAVLSILHFVDGLTVTLHEFRDVVHLNFLTHILNWSNIPKGKSMRLNVFKGIDGNTIDRSNFWITQYNRVWDKECPLPEGEVLMRL